MGYKKGEVKQWVKIAYELANYQWKGVRVEYLAKKYIEDHPDEDVTYDDVCHVARMLKLGIKKIKGEWSVVREV